VNFGAPAVTPSATVVASGTVANTGAPVTTGNFSPGTVAPMGTGPNAAPRVRDRGTTTPQGPTGTTTTRRQNQ